MNRLHVHFKVRDLEQSIGFYSALFGKGPDKREPDYAKWILDDPRANIAISARGAETGVDHVGLQVDNDEELAVLAARLKDARADIVEEANATCCYARSNKYWARSPEGAKWELYHTFGESVTFGTAPQDRPAAVAPVSPVAKSLEPKACCG